MAPANFALIKRYSLNPGDVITGQLDALYGFQQERPGNQRSRVSGTGEGHSVQRVSIVWPVLGDIV